MRKIFFLWVLLLGFSQVYGQEVSTVVVSKDTLKIENTEWKALSIKDRTLPKDTKVRIRFDVLKDGKGKVSGNSGCNGFFGNYYLSEGEHGETILGFSQLGSTRMACVSKEISQIEEEFLSILPFVKTVMLLDGKMSLQTVDGKVVIVLEPSKE